MKPEDFKHLMSPSSVFVVCSLMENDETHAAPFSWVMAVNYEPPLVMISCRRDSVSLGNIRAGRRFLIARPGAWMAQKVLLLSRKWLKPGKMQHLESGLMMEKLSPGGLGKLLRPSDIVAWAELRFRREVDLGNEMDHVLIFGEVIDGEVYRETLTDGLLYDNQKTFGRLGEWFEVEGY